MHATAGLLHTMHCRSPNVPLSQLAAHRLHTHRCPQGRKAWVKGSAKHTMHRRSEPLSSAVSDSSVTAAAADSRRTPADASARDVTSSARFRPRYPSRSRP